MVSAISAISKVLAVLKISGCFPFYSYDSEFRIKKSDKNFNIYTILVFFIVQTSAAFLLYGCIVDFKKYFPWKNKGNTDSTSQVFEVILCVSVYSLMQILCIINFSRFITIMNSILEIDWEIKRKFHRELDNKKLKTFNSIVMIGIIGHIIVLITSLIMTSAENKYHLFILAYVFQLIMTTSYVIFFTSLVKLIVARLIIVNSLFQSVSAMPDEDLKSFFRVVEIFKMVEKTFGAIDDSNGLILLFYLAYVFYTLTNEIYIFAFMVSEVEKEIIRFIVSFMWIVHHIWILWELSMNCGLYPPEAKRTAQIMSRIYGKGKDYQNMIDKFLTKSIKQEVKFSAYGFFVIDNSTLFKIVSAVTTYLVILIQFKQLEDTKNSN